VIAAVLLDLDETLLDRTASLRAFLADQHERFAARLGGASRELWCRRFVELDARGMVHKSIVYPALLAEFGGNHGAADALLADYRERCCRHARAFAGTTETLQALRDRGTRLAIVTNGETAFQHRHITALGLQKLVDAVLISETEGLRKPEKALFWRAAGRLGTDPADCLFVGDSPTADILGAHAAGMQTAWFTRNDPWPADLPPMPGIAIRSLPEILAIERQPMRR
jgi:putative hydrolase of the HAD superfamily